MAIYQLLPPGPRILPKNNGGKSVKLANHCYAKTSFVYFKNTQTMQILNNSAIRSVDFIYFFSVSKRWPYVKFPFLSVHRT